MSFEKSFQRLEAILEQLNSGEVSLDDSLKLYEEANTLIVGCNQALNQAEQRVSTLIRNRQGDLQLGADGQPVQEEFPAESQ